MSVVGLDFGSTNCVIAAAGKGGIDTILNGNSNRLNPNISAFSDKVRGCGESAASTYTSNYKNSITGMKRLIGLKFNDPRVTIESKYLPLKLVENPENGGVAVSVMYEGSPTVVSIEHATGMMISHMSSIAKAANKDVAPQDWVVAVPPYFSDQQKRSLLDACEIVGVNCQRLFHETTASALAYGIFKDLKKEFSQTEPTYVMFIDFGATSMSAQVVQFTKQKLTVMSTQWDEYLGGR